MKNDSVRKIENIDKTIEQLRKLKIVLRQKLSKVDLQISQQQMKKSKMKHLKSLKEYFSFN
ncbi:MAG: hypothetical protein HOE16_05480 [Lentimicrobiaceae bacterium]|jgi:hypothetical protein|nr:hypothetical protein [Lentimicrobiaceae bacterium]MBT4190632.1 hypothetical protein [Lentimicrobiaceae bacterium]MBT4801501.1 hypothetical protein [Lentimicrobiaceae bacterium]MBT5164206.1 hypothetical protein [Lentimicrobiaceae bacterium]MBT5669997.1 hypothetical protein [Lentimicrobiaceae bacterium]